MFSVADVLDELNRLGISNLTHSLGKDSKSAGWDKLSASNPVNFVNELRKQISEGANWKQVKSLEITTSQDLEGMMMAIKPTEATRKNGWTFHPKHRHIVIMDNNLSGFSDGEMKFELRELKRLVE